MISNKDRGKLLLAVMVRSARWQALLWVLIVGFLAVCLTEFLMRGKTDAFSYVGVVAPLLGYALYPRVRFFEGGIDIPPAPDNQRLYIRWDQIERYSWDGDKLVVTGTSSILAGGPIKGGIVAISPSKRREVETLLALKLPAKK
jgi:hypothetical protein